jgi:hypothetical protein
MSRQVRYDFHVYSRCLFTAYVASKLPLGASPCFLHTSHAEEVANALRRALLVRYINVPP